MIPRCGGGGANAAVCRQDCQRSGKKDAAGASISSSNKAAFFERGEVIAPEIFREKEGALADMER